ncbi:1,2-phenylacetyl-CoA epoxidase subunit PaaD [Roseomonas mucosa]|nr:1,2-phenylacetyl-CoA epoxidase subunit PaaD [Roseomonas mucosa]MDT8275291.1 1,2-phenylacetyl-CoA epoxidase subunit PaaD [Roseomonas mucosa]
MVSAAETLRDRALRAAAEVVDPEIPVLTIADLGVLRDVREVDGAVEVEVALERAGIPRARVRTVLSPAWTTDWMTEEGRRKLHDYGIAPPGRTGGRRALFGEEDEVACPRCGSARTERIAEFGSTSCKALWRCLACREPFDHFRCH